MTGLFDRQTGVNVTSGIRLSTPADWPEKAQVHEGHWGWTSQQILRGNELQPQRGRLGEWLRRGTCCAKDTADSTVHSYSPLPWPDVALVHLGTNDLTQSVFNLGKSVQVVTQHISAVVQRLCRANPVIIVLLAYPM